MWANITPHLAKFPRQPHDSAGDWSACATDLERYRGYADDWDGQQAKGIPHNLIDGATALAGLLRAQGIDPPTCVLPGFNGTVIFQWDMPADRSVSLEITGPESAALECYAPTESLEVIEIAEPVAA